MNPRLGGDIFIFSAILWIFMLLASSSVAQEPIRIGVLHSLTGTMAFSEKPLKDTLMLLIEEQNRKGGLLGRPLEAVILDPASNPLLFAEKARQLIEREKVDVIFGCWTSASRKAVLPIIEESNRLLFYPVQYEGQEQSENIFYFGATPNQQAIPAVNYLQQERSIERWVLAGSDYVYPRAVNRILASYLKYLGVSTEDIMLSYTPLGNKDWQRVVAEMFIFSNQGKRTAVLSTINGDANLSFYQELAKQGIDPSVMPVLAFSVGEGELQQMNLESSAGYMAAWNYFMALDTDKNRSFIEQVQAYNGNKNRVTNDPMEGHYIGFNMWLKAVDKAKTVDTDHVREAMIGISTKNLSGEVTQMLPNHHTVKPVYIGESDAGGQFRILWSSGKPVAADPWPQLTPREEQ